MGDKEVKIEKIKYSEEELQEIERIIGIVTGGDTFNDIVTRPPVEETEPEELEFPGLEAEEEFTSDTFIGEPDDLDLPVGDLDSITSDGREVVDDMGSIVPEEIAGSEIFGEPEEEIDEIEDISDLIQEIEEFSEIPGDKIEPVSVPVEDERLIDDLEISEGTDDELVFQEPEEITPGLEAFEEETEAAGERTALDQLDDLTDGEPESVDLQDLAEDTFVGEEVALQDLDFPSEDLGEVPETGEIEELPDDFGEGTFEAVDETVSLDRDAEMDIPDLSDLTLEDAGEIPEATESDIPDIDLGDVSGEEEAPEDMDISDTDFAPPEMEDLREIDIPVDEESFGDIGDVGDVGDVGDIEPLDEAGGAFDEVSDIPVSEIHDEEPMLIEPLEDEPVETIPAQVPGAGELLELSDSDLKKLKKAIILFNPSLRREIKDTVINDLLPVDELQQLVEMIISGRPEDNIHRFLEKKLKKKIELADEAVTTGRRVITSRGEYTKEGRERQKRLLKFTKIFGGAALFAFLVTLLSYQYLYKPYMAKKTINEGVGFILSSGDYQKKPKDYLKAEELARYVEENYAKDYLYGYNAYGRAYFDKKEYNRSLQKLDRAFELKGDFVKTLNNLGYFYARVPAEYYRTVRGDVERKYFGKRKLEDGEKSQLNLAVSFYQRALLLDNKNISSLLGIGNAYFHQGQFLKAKKYYDDILRVDRRSIVGHSGLINLYIERDAFSEVATSFADLREKKMLKELPSALLGKLAVYFLSKTKTEKGNVRIDYGVRTSRIKDQDDNTYPAVRTILQALNRRDPNYPPLHVYFALLNEKQNNLLAMQRHLEKAVDLSPRYFTALHLLGEFYYKTKEPVEAYRLLNEAIKSYGSQPDFTRDDFYREIINVGKTQAVLGNIFYYFFDKIRFKFGDLEDRLIDDDREKMANYSIAREKYESAVREGYSSPELNYNLGRIYYLNKLYRKAIDQWLHLYDDFVKSPELMFALGNAFYHLGNYEAGKGEYLKFISVSEYDAEKIKFVEISRKEHVKLFGTLASVYNNLGAIYQKQNEEGKSSLSYWKAIDYAKRLNVENDFARVNLARTYKPGRKVEPIIDENIPFSIDYYREGMRQ